MLGKAMFVLSAIALVVIGSPLSLAPASAAPAPERALTTDVTAGIGVADASPAQARAEPACGPANFRAYHLPVPGATTPGVTVYNYSCFSTAPNQNLNTLIYRADEGLVSRTPESTATPGLMANGDVVVVTSYAIYWISVNSSLGVSNGRSYSGSGLIAGEWPIAPSQSGSPQPVFADTVGANHWAPNWLLPGSKGAGISTLVNGLGVRVVPDCGTDASSIPGTGTFVVEGTPDQASFRTPASGVPHEHLFQFSGMLEQEDTPGDTTLADCEGHSTTVSFVLTYSFYDALDPTLAYGGVTSEARLNRVEVSIRPDTSNLAISDFGVGDDLQTLGGGLPIPTIMSDTTEALQRYAAPGDQCGFSDASFPAGAEGSICGAAPTSGQPSTEIQESTGLQLEDNPPTYGLAPGNIAAFTSAGGGYALSYLHPASSDPKMPPLRDSMVWNTSLGGVSAVETQFVGETDNPVTLKKGQAVDVLQDQDLGQNLNPPKPATLVVSPAILPASGGTLDIAYSTLAGYEMTSNPALDVTTGASSHHSVDIPANNTGAPLTYTFDLHPRDGVTLDAPQPVRVVQAAAPVAVFTAQAGALPAAPLELNGASSFEKGGTITSYLWHFGDGGSAGGPVVDHVFPDPGRYVVTLTVSDSRGQQATSAEMVTVARAGHAQRHVSRPG